MAAQESIEQCALCIEPSLRRTCSHSSYRPTASIGVQLSHAVTWSPSVA